MADIEQQVYEAVRAAMTTALSPFASDIDVFIPNGPSVDPANQVKPFVMYDITFDRVARGSLGHAPVQIITGNVQVGIFEKEGESIWYTSQVKQALRTALLGGGYIGPAEFISAQPVSPGRPLPEWRPSGMQYLFRANDCP